MKFFRRVGGGVINILLSSKFYLYILISINLFSK
nr:MAG TPA: hypothetical protein [Caudoviricetes sp.]